MSLQFGYFNIQGRGQVSRLLLAYTKTQYNEVTYSFGRLADWLQNDKVNLGLDFPSLPYLIDGKLKLTESKAIELYIIHRAKMASIMLGKNHKEQALIDNIDGVLKDVFNALIGIFFAADFSAERKRIYPSLEQKLNYLNEYIGSKNNFLNRITYVDFVLTVVFTYLQLFYPYEFSNWSNIQRVADYINALPQIVKYYNTKGAISDVVAPERANDPRFHNIPSIHQTQKKQVQTVGSVEIEQKVSPVEQERISSEETYPVQEHISPIEEFIEQSKIEQQVIKKTQSLIEQENIAREPQQQQQSISHEKIFNEMVSEYQKAVQEANTVEYSQVNINMKKSSIVTPSKIESSIKANGSLEASWKILNLDQQKNQVESKSSSITLGYWGIRGLGQIQRHLLTYCGHEFTETIYRTRQQWVNADKRSLPFPNLPYLISGDFRLTESLAIDRYIIRTSNKHELLGKNLLDETLIENIVKILSQIFKQLRVLCFTTEETEQKKSKLLSRIDTDFKRMNDFIKNREFAFGYLTWTDFYIAEVSYYIQKIFPNVYEKYSFLKNIQHAVNKIDDVQKYYERKSFVKGPFMPPSAQIFF